MTSVKNDISWKLFSLGYAGLAVLVAGIVLASTAHWLFGGMLAAIGGAAFVAFFFGVAVHVKKHGHPVMDFERFGKTFRWW
jgi:hypothetical protein